MPVAGGGAYYFAKKEINADRIARFEAEQRRRRVQDNLEYSATHSSKAGSDGGAPKADHGASPSSEATSDPAPTRHAPESEGQQIREKSKYETSQPFKARKGDRFS